jgi:hypothetical protein
MTPDKDQSQALEGFGYTARQAQFLALVALHGGYFLRRQYVTFTGRAHGQAAVRFLANAIGRAHIRVLPYGRQGRVFHLYARPLYAAIGEEHNRNRRAAEWEAVLRKLMTVDFVLAHPRARFWATETDKIAVLRDRGIPTAVWPARRYAPKQDGVATTTRYFVDKMPWYQTEDDPRLWFAYVDAERTLRGFETFLSQYRPLLSAVSSGVTYVAPTVWRGSIEAVFTRALASTGGHALNLTTVRDYFTLRRLVDEERWASLGVAEIDRFRELRSLCAHAAIQALYERWLTREDGSLLAEEVHAASRSDCALRVHALGRTYDAERASSELGSNKAKVT